MQNLTEMLNIYLRIPFRRFLTDPKTEIVQDGDSRVLLRRDDSRYSEQKQSALSHSPWWRENRTSFPSAIMRVERNTCLSELNLSLIYCVYLNPQKITLNFL